MHLIFAIHWIVTTHGTWLHGDRRGSWKDGQLIGPDPKLWRVAQECMSRPPESLSPSEIALVARSFGDTCREQRHRVLAATVQPLHAHLVLAPIDQPMRTVIARLKRRASVAVFADRRSRGVQPPPSLWTDGRFFRMVFDEQDLAYTINYVCDHNTDAGLPRNPFAWIDPPGWSEM